MNKEKIEMEFPIHSSPKILYNCLSTATGLQSWFADEVNEHDGFFEFRWGEEVMRAKPVHKRESKLMVFKWLNQPEDYTLEFEILTDELTNDVSLVVRDYCLIDDVEETKRLWDSQIHNLKHIIGS
ncbi:MAG: SRPBCC domain-containing protein [Bacteroidia bacterium]|nr:SRPBCC domain-containing protein [Bacteroidia bacterium]